MAGSGFFIAAGKPHPFDFVDFAGGKNVLPDDGFFERTLEGLMPGGRGILRRWDRRGACVGPGGSC